MGLALQEIQPWHRADKTLQTAARALHDALFALAYSRHFYRNGAGVDAVVRATRGQIGHACAGDHGLGGGTSHVDTGTAKVAALNERNCPSGLRESAGEESASPAATHYNRIILGG